jgi:hypothetical protein
VSLTVLSIAYPLAPIGADGAEQVLHQFDKGLVRAGHRSIVIGCAGSEVSGTLLAVPAPPAAIGEAERARGAYGLSPPHCRCARAFAGRHRSLSRLGLRALPAAARRARAGDVSPAAELVSARGVPALPAHLPQLRGRPRSSAPVRRAR